MYVCSYILLLRFQQKDLLGIFLSCLKGMNSSAISHGLESEDNLFLYLNSASTHPCLLLVLSLKSFTRRIFFLPLYSQISTLSSLQEMGECRTAQQSYDQNWHVPFLSKWDHLMVNNDHEL